MYDSHIYCREYKELKGIISHIYNTGDDMFDIEELEKHIQELYEDGEIASYQYDDLMSYIQDMI